jgi:hypothetical protein
MKPLKFIAIFLGSLLTIAFISLIVLAYMGPDTSVYLGEQVPSRFEHKVRDLGLIAPDEKMRFFYSDAFYDIGGGMYLATNKSLVLYSDQWSEKAIKLPLDQIENIDATYTDSTMEDSVVTVTDKESNEYTFPLSSEYGRDHMFVEYISSHIIPDSEQSHQNNQAVQYQS